MKRAVRQLSRLSPIPAMLPPVWALRRVTSKSGKGVYASSDTLFKGAVFGRDSLEVGEDLLELRPKLVRRIIITLASLQGEVANDISEEEPGKIVHEYRTITVDGRRLDDMSRHIFEELSRRWGGNEKDMAYFGSIDATPHFIRLVGKYTEKHGNKILNVKVKLRSSHTLPLKLVVENALFWLTESLRKSNSGLLEYKRRNPRGIENQVWKDSREFYIHEDGSKVNHGLPIASIEVQGLVYDALMTGARLFPNRKVEFIEKAHQVRDSTFDRLWLKDKWYFALGIDYEQNKEPRIIRTMTANPAALLDSSIFDDVDEDARKLYISHIVRTIMGHNFLTDAGIRSRSLSESGLIDHWDYHGTFTTWPKETFDIAKGLRRQGFPKLADELENRLINVVFKNKEYPEFIYVDEMGRVMSNSPNPHEHGGVVMIDSTNSPERIQAWTVSAVVAILAVRPHVSLLRLRPKKKSDWKTELERHIMARIPHVKRLIANPSALTARYPHYPYQVKPSPDNQPGNLL